ncbi:6-bladed beta-propeller [Parabacteroides sp. AM08-6]|uniref:6-bladed beta-propeller n=1 Tax=Parabacteroides sp. AM08-6 TaxID=2292053 RepID=UPI000F000C7D|nr:6-bladed beta-propeller [Parabacteroides sp. AM08-6]RHJ78387.1 6-bladed beta-propeller [Parabacteroides sp. AM08-6]
MKKHFKIILLLIILCVCTDIKTLTGQGIINIEVGENIKEVNLSDIIESIEIIPLETSDEVLLGEIYALSYDEEKYFVQNANNLLIYVFDKKGKFERQLTRKGNGPGEIQFPESYTLDKINKEVWLSNNNTFLRYDYQGTYLGKRDYSLAFKSFCIDKNKNIYFYTGKNDNHHIQDGFLTGDLTLLTPDNKKRTWFKSKLVGYYKTGESIRSYPSSHPFSIQKDNSITFSYTFNDTIYSIKDNSLIEPKYCIHLGEKKISSNALNDMPGKDLKAYFQENTNTKWNINNVFENQQYLYFTYLKGFKSSYVVLYNKETKEISNMSLKDDLLGSEWLAIADCTASSFIGYIPAYQIKINEKILSFISQEQLAQLKESTADDNPILFKLTFKKRIQ